MSMAGRSGVSVNMWQLPAAVAAAVAAAAAAEAARTAVCAHEDLQGWL